MRMSFIVECGRPMPHRSLRRGLSSSTRPFWTTTSLPESAGRLRELRPALIDEFASDLRGAGVGEETIRKSLAILQTCLQRAVLHDRLARNPVTAVRKPSQARRRVIEPLAPERGSTGRA
jgi:site-specific recombinase XerC